MQSPYRFPHLAGALLLAATPFVSAAESPMPDPIAPAVIGRPLDQIRPARPAHRNPAAAKVNRPKPVVAVTKVAPKPTHAAAAVAPPAVVQAAVAPPAAAAQASLDAPRAPKQEADRVDPRAQVVDNVGQGPADGIRPTAPGVYFGTKAQAVVRKFYATRPVSRQASSWTIGEPVPKRADMTGVPDEVRAALPPVPPGHQYVQLNDEVVIVAVPSRMVVDGVSRAVR